MYTHTYIHTYIHAYIHTYISIEYYLSKEPPKLNKAIEHSRLRPLMRNVLFASTAESVGGNAERGGAEALKLRPSLRCLPLIDIPRP